MVIGFGYKQRVIDVERPAEYFSLVFDFEQIFSNVPVASVFFSFSIFFVAGFVLGSIFPIS